MAKSTKHDKMSYKKHDERLYIDMLSRECTKK